MSNETAILQLIRETLEGVLAPELAAAVFFEALSTAEAAPDDRSSLIRFVRGPLRDVLAQRIGADEAASAIGRVLLPLEAATRPDAKRRRDEHPTRAVPLSDHPVPVSIVSAGQSLAIRLRAALGPTRIDARATPSAIEVANQRVPVPQIVIVDAGDFPPAEPTQLAAAFRLLPSTAARVVWASDFPYGQRLVEALKAESQTALALTREVGIDPLIDLIRSRKKI